MLIYLAKWYIKDIGWRAPTVGSSMLSRMVRMALIGLLWRIALPKVRTAVNWLRANRTSKSQAMVADFWRVSLLKPSCSSARVRESARLHRRRESAAGRRSETQSVWQRAPARCGGARPPPTSVLLAAAVDAVETSRFNYEVTPLLWFLPILLLGKFHYERVLRALETVQFASCALSREVVILHSFVCAKLSVCHDSIDISILLIAVTFSLWYPESETVCLWALPSENT